MTQKDMSDKNYSSNVENTLEVDNKKAACNSCHVAGDTKKELPTNCYSCNKNDDSHKGRNGKKCNDCHESSSWRTDPAA